MSDPRLSVHMTVPLKDFGRVDVNIQFAQDLGPCDVCSGCRPDVTDMVMKKSARICIMCNKNGPQKCGACHDAEYCSTDCQRADWSMHKLVCKKFINLPTESRPSEKHFRVILFPYQASQPEFCWAYLNEEGELVVSHSSIDDWKTEKRGRYEKSEKDPLIIHALSRDYAMEGKVLGHGIRIASWQPAKGPIGHLEGFNETIVSLAGPLSSRSYGPLVAFAYNLDSKFNHESMDDMSTNDFRHLVDFFHNSAWNPTIGQVDRYPKKAISGLFIPDPNIPAEAGDRKLAICQIVRTHQPVMSCTIAATLNFNQTCWHAMCKPETSPIKQMCPKGSMWHAFLLGPLLLGLPWVGRNVMVTDVHDQGNRRSVPDSRRWEYSYSRLLCQGVRLGHRCITIDVLPKSDGIIVFNAFGTKMNPLYLIAYDEFIYRNQQSDQSQRVCTKEKFLEFWIELKEGKTKIMNQKKEHENLDFGQAISPYHTVADAQPVFAQDASQAFLYLRELFQNQEFRKLTHKYEVSSIFDKVLLPERWRVGEKFWQDDLNELYFRLVRAPPTSEKEKGKDTSQAALSTGNALAEFAQASLNIMEK